MSEELLYTVKEAAAALRLSTSMVYELVGRGEIPSTRVGRAIRVPKAGLLQWIDEQVAATAAAL
jgi:excisionase family DNA binding protein